MGRARPPASLAGARNCGGLRAAFVSRSPGACAPAVAASLRLAHGAALAEGPASASAVSPAAPHGA
eukprot:11007224-Alexandrium_andersonii.AAC.1